VLEVPHALAAIGAGRSMAALDRDLRRGVGPAGESAVKAGAAKPARKSSSARRLSLAGIGPD